MANRSLTNSRVTAQINATIQNTLDDGKVVSSSIAAITNDSLANGVSSSQANRGWQYYQKSLGSGASITIDLFDMGALDVGAGAGLDALGQALEIREIVAIKIKNDNAVGAVGTLEIIPAVANGWSPIGSHTVATGGGLRGGGVLLKYQPDTDGFPVTDAANHQITLTANGGAVTYSVWLLGRHDTDESSSSSSSSSSQSVSSTSSSSQSNSSSSCSSLSSRSVSSSSSCSSTSSEPSSSSSSCISTSSSPTSGSSVSSVSSSTNSSISTSMSSSSCISTSSPSESSPSSSSQSSWSSLSSASSTSSSSSQT